MKANDDNHRVLWDWTWNIFRIPFLDPSFVEHFWAVIKNHRNGTKEKAKRKIYMFEDDCVVMRSVELKFFHMNQPEMSARSKKKKILFCIWQTFESCARCAIEHSLIYWWRGLWTLRDENSSCMFKTFAAATSCFCFSMARSEKLQKTALTFSAC